VNVQSVRIVDIRQIDESENTVNYNEESNNSGGVQGTNLISGKWYTGECLADGASPRATIEWSIDGNGTLADEIPSSPMTTRITVIEVSIIVILTSYYAIVIFSVYLDRTNFNFIPHNITRHIPYGTLYDALFYF
jgi:hypothetical protein